MNLIYFFDFMHVKKYGLPVTYDTYVNLEHGPIPSAIKNLVDAVDDEVENAILADSIVVNHDRNESIHRVIPVRELTDSEMELFSQSEIEILKSVVARYGAANTKTIEDASHKEAPCLRTNELDRISYSLAALDADSVVSKEEIDLLMSI
jgi:uncharacterized phage-associated protein